MRRAKPSADPNWLEAWRLGRKMSKREACRVLGIAFNTLAAYEADESKIPVSIALACAAIAYGIPPMGGNRA
jgi:transcriptional regulator with XRE-family HTH domain